MKTRSMAFLMLLASQCLAAGSAGAVTFGQSTPGTHSAYTCAGSCLGTFFTAGSTGTINQIQIYVDQVPAGGAHFNVAMYSNAPTMDPQTRLTQGTSQLVTAAGWAVFNVPSTAVTSGTTYWLMFETDDNNAYINFAYDTNNWRSEGADAVYDDFPTSFPAYNWNDRWIFSIYATEVATPTPTPSATNARTSTNTPTLTVSGTETPTLTSTPTSTQSATFTDTPTPTPTATGSPTATPTPTLTASGTWTATATGSPTATATPTLTASASLTATATGTLTATGTPTLTPSPSTTATATATLTATGTPTLTPSPSVTATPTFTDTATGTPTSTHSATATATGTATSTRTATMTRTMTPTPTATATATMTPTRTPTFTATKTATATPPYTRTITPTMTDTPTATPTSTASPTRTITITASCTSTVTKTPTITMTRTISPTSTVSPTVTPTLVVQYLSGDLTHVIVYPNPWRKDRSTSRNRVVFINLTRQAVIRLYSLDGNRVRTIEAQESSDGGQTTNPGNTGRAEWALTNQTGKPVASGVYIYIVADTEGHKAVGKIAILR